MVSIDTGTLRYTAFRPATSPAAVQPVNASMAGGGLGEKTRRRHPKQDWPAKPLKPRKTALAQSIEEITGTPSPTAPNAAKLRAYTDLARWEAAEEQNNLIDVRL